MDEIFSIWPSDAELARDLSCSRKNPCAWRHRRNIPAAYHKDMIEAAAKRGRKLTFEDIAKANAAAKNQEDVAQ